MRQKYLINTETPNIFSNNAPFTTFLKRNIITPFHHHPLIINTQHSTPNTLQN
jgi:hypothetical protein